MIRHTFLLFWLVAATAFATLEPDMMWTYKAVDGRDLELSVFLPENYETGKAFPTFVVFHGGSWNAGDPNWHYPDCSYWSNRGMIAVSAQYRLKTRDKVQVPLECVKDAKSAIRYLRKHAERLKVDVDRIVVAGGSAGGQLAAATVMIDAANTNDDQDDLSISCIPNAVILYNPWFKCQPDLSPPNFIRAGIPPCITFLGEDDPTPVDELKAFHDALKSAGNASEYYIGKGAGHGFCNGRNPRNPFFYWSLELEDQFLVRHNILTGTANVQIPTGVKVLKPGDDYDAY